MPQLAAIAITKWKPVLRILHDADFFVFVRLQKNRQQQLADSLTVAGVSPYKLSWKC